MKRCIMVKSMFFVQLITISSNLMERSMRTYTDLPQDTISTRMLLPKHGTKEAVGAKLH